VFSIAEQYYVLIDGTGTVSRSEKIARAMPGHSKKNGYIPQVNQIYVLSVSEKGSAPAFYRNVAGNVPDVTALQLTVADAGIPNAVLIVDAGFASADNFSNLVGAGLD
jgi:transposase